ncbi:MAG: CRISPR system precrRNA processing endoribonuclease RAMP protein Cas6 [Promethearchaeota archaeon]
MLRKISQFEEPTIISFKFHIAPVHVENRIFKFHGYLLRGLLMNWLKQFNKQLGDELHQTDKPGTKILREYSISNYFHNIGKDQISKNHKNFRIGIFELNIFKNDFSEEIIKFLLNLKKNTFIIGNQLCSIIKTDVEVIPISKIFNISKPLDFFTLKFKSPTAFKNLNTNALLRTPEPHKVFSSLLKLWNSMCLETSYEAPKNLYNWVLNSISIVQQKNDVRIAKWNMGKSVKFTGFMGTFSFQIGSSFMSRQDIESRIWIHRLLKFGEYSHVGAQRTAGFGRYKIIRTRFLPEQPLSNN